MTPLRSRIAAIVAAVSLLAPSLAGAQYYGGRGWNQYPEITPSGPPSIVFPVEGGATFSDDFGDPRSGGRTHEGNDLLAPKMKPIVAARGGRVVFAPFTQPSYGYILTIAGDDGYTYNYLHINNDTPGTDDGNGGPQYAYAPGIEEGVQVVQGQHIAWVGDSGNAESVGSHLHFEIRLPDDTPIDPYQYLLAALQIYTYDVAAAKAASPTINSDMGLIVTPATVLYCVPGSLIQLPTSTAVYYCGSDGKRYVFPNSRTYATWYKDFSAVQKITPEDMANIPLGGNVTYRPGVKLVKVQTDPKVYAVDRNGTLRWVETAAIAAKYYGTAWAKSVEDIPDVFFIDYTIGNSINR
jgi:hypothetical protein